MLRAKRVLAGIIDLYISYICITGLFILLKEPMINKLQDFELFLDIYNMSWYISLVFKDIIFKNASIGKRLVGIEIVGINNEPVKFYILILRNLLLPIVYPFYFVTILLLNRRYSDRVFKIKIVFRNKNLLQESSFRGDLKMNKENNWNSKKRNSLLKKIFFIPVGLWLVLCFIAMLPDANDGDPLTLGELIFTNIFIIPFWFTISFIITSVVSWIINKSGENVEEKNMSVSKNANINANDYKLIVSNIENNSLKEEKNVISNKLETKKEDKRKSNDKCFYTCESIIDAYEFKKMAKYFPKRMYWVFVIRGTYLNILLSAIFAIVFRNFIGTLIFFILFELYAMLIYKLELEKMAEKTFNSYLKKGLSDTDIETEFYEDYFIRKGKTLSLTIKYTDISRCVENDTNFYLEYPIRNTVVIIQKNKCDLELINFIREKFNNLESHSKDSSKVKNTEKYHNPKFIKNMMTVLFILSIISVWASMITWMMVNEINNIPNIIFNKTACVTWFWLPIPILSTILGFKYKNMGFMCTKNIVAGLIVSFLLLMLGSFCFFPTFEEDYDKIYAYQDIIGLELPSNGLLEIRNWGTYFDVDKTEYSVIKVYYNKEDVSILEKEIEGGSNWGLSTKIKSNLKIFIPPTFISDADVYYSIYNKTLDEYNEIPNEEGFYEIYTMKYDKTNKLLEIHNYNYLYK